jgi:hypothetical protein
MLEMVIVFWCESQTYFLLVLALRGKPMRGDIRGSSGNPSLGGNVKVLELSRALNIYPDWIYVPGLEM